MLEQFYEIYEYLQGVFLSSPSYCVKRSKRRDLMISSFLKKNKIEDIGALWGYLVFCFVVFESKKSRFSVLPINNITSKNAKNQYDSRSQEMDFTVESIKIKKGLRNPLRKESEKHVFAKEYLEKQRQKFFNTPRGFIHCSDFGIENIYERGTCITCKYKKECESKVKK